MIPNRYLPVAEWLPDQPEYEGGTARVVNAIPQASSYRAINGLVSLTDELDSRVFRGFVAKDDSGVVNNFAGDAGKLYRLSGTTWGDVSKAGGYTVTNWEFAKYGERIIAASKAEPIQYYDLGVSALFADLAGSPPKAEHVAVVRDFVVLGNLDDGGTQYPARVQWSGFNNSEVWGVDLATQTDFQDLLGNGGEIQRIVGGEYGVIFQENSIWRMDYVGPSTVFRFDEVERGRGTPAPNSVCWQGEQIFYWGNDGFYLFNGVSSQPIGAEKVDRYVKNRVDTSRYSEFVGAVDRRNRLVVWSVPLLEGGSELIIFSWAIGKWGQSSAQIEAINEFADAGYTLDDLDTILTDIDTDSIPVDSPEFRGGSLKLAAFTTAHRLATFSGAQLDIEVDTAETADPNGGRLFIDTVRPAVEGGTASVALISRNNIGGNAVTGDFKVINDIGECQYHKDVRFLRFRIRATGGCEHIQGVRAYYKPAGRR